MTSVTKIADCHSCTLDLKQMVRGKGAQSPEIMFIGEAPGKNEVIRKEPFVGKAGTLLRQTCLLVGVDTEKLYYTNACLCRPPKNRDPSVIEVVSCRNRLLREIEAVSPKVIMPLGGVAYATVSGEMPKEGSKAKTFPKPSITKLRGKPFYLDDIPVIPSLHPAGLLRSPDGFIDLCHDLELALAALRGEPLIIYPPIEDYVIVPYEGNPYDSTMDDLFDRLENLERMVIDLETTSLRYLGENILCCGLSWMKEFAVCFDWEFIHVNKEYHDKLSEALARVGCVFHNAAFDIPWLHDEGFSEVNLVFDTMLAHYLLDERRGSHGLERLSVDRYRSPAYKFSSDEMKNAEDIPRLDLLRYCATDVDYTQRLDLDLTQELIEDGKDGLMDDIMIPATNHLIDLFESGMRVDREYLESLGRLWEAEIEEINGKLRSFPGAKDINPNSPAQVGRYLYDVLELRQMKGGFPTTLDQYMLLEEIQDIEDPEAQEYWRTQSSKQSANMSPRTTNTYMLYWLAQQHEWPRLMVHHRLFSKKLGTYYKGLVNSLWPDGRMRPNVRLHGTVTGRESSSDPNIHGTPKGKQIKNVYIADEGMYILYADYSQAEIRMIAHYAGDEKLIEAMDEKDIHYAICKRLFSLTDNQMEDLDEERREALRRAAKTITFGIIYGRSDKGLATQLGKPIEEAAFFKSLFFNDMPGVQRWISDQKALALREKSVKSLYGRERRFSLIADKKQAAEVGRMAVNMPVQHAVSEMTLRAHIKTVKTLRQVGIRTLIWPHVHDAFMVQVQKDKVFEAAQIMERIMTKEMDFETSVSFPAEIKVGERWGDLHPISTLLRSPGLV